VLLSLATARVKLFSKGGITMNGFYAVYYTGKTGSGFAVIVFKDGIITGADMSGGLYDGQYTISEDGRILEGTITLTVAPGVSLVTGAPVSHVSYTQQFPISFPWTPFDPEHSPYSFTRLPDP
jgi:hypothetical protein